MKPVLDPTLPGLSTALDLDAVLDLLRGALPECREGLELIAGNILDVRYLPGSPCWILYRLKVRKPARRSSHQLFSARVLRAQEQPGPLPGELLARYQARRDNIFRTPMVYLPQAHMTLYAFPVDTALPWLMEAVDAATMRRHLNRLWAPRNVRVCEVVPRQLGYTPQARAVFLYEVLSESRDTRLPELRWLIGKMHARKAAARLFAGAWALWSAAGKSVSLAPPVGYIPSASLTLQEQVHGERLGALAAAPGFVKRVRQTARMVAAMHKLSLPLTTRRKPEDEAQVVHRWAGVLAAVRPDMSQWIENLRDRLASELQSRARVAGAPVHGDFHHTNVLVHNDGVTIIDLDEMAYGDPMLDVGRFLASLRIPALRASGSLSGLSEAGETFLSEYLARAPGDEKRARLFEAASLVTAAASSFRIQRPMWKEEIAMLVEEAERILRLAGSSAKPGAASKASPPPGPVAERERWARDGVYMQAALDPHIRNAYGAVVTRLKVAGGTKTERGDRIRYNLRGWYPDERGGRRQEKWGVSLQGIPWREHGGKRFLKRLETLRSALEGSPQAPLLPLAVAYLHPLSLLVWEAPAGIRFSSLIGSGDAPEAAARVGRALAALHNTPVALDSQHPLERELKALRLKVERLEESSSGLLARALPLLEEVEKRIRAAPANAAPTVRTLHPHHVLLAERVALAKVEEVRLSHPLLDVGDFLARLTLLGMSRGTAHEAGEAAVRFRAAYALAGAAPEESIAGFEAGALLRLAWAQVARGSAGALPERLLDEAAAKLEP